MTINIEDLGISKEELRERVVKGICDSVFYELQLDDEGCQKTTKFNRELFKRVEEIIKDKVDEIGDKVLKKEISSLVDGILLQEHTRWGATVGNTFTLDEYIVAQAEKYLLEPVDYQGKPKGTDCWQWKAYGTRVSHMVHQYLNMQIESAMKTIIGNANSILMKGIEEAIKIKLDEIAKSLKVTATTK